MREYKTYLKQETRGKGKVWRAILSYTVPNPDYIPKPDGIDNRSARQRRKTIEKQLTKTFSTDVRTKTQANKALNAFLEETKRRDSLNSDSNKLISAYLEDYERSEENRIEASTASGYKTLDKIISNEFANVRLHELTAEDISTWVRKMQKSGKSDATVAKCYKRLKKVYSEAVRCGDMPSNPFDRTTPPKSPKASPNALTKESLKRLTALLDSMEDTPVKLACLLGLHLGLRAGEICALKWSDLDTKNKVLHVQRSIGRATGESATYIKGTKTDSSNRFLPLSESMMDALEKRLMGVSVDLAMAGLELSEDELGEFYIVGMIDGRYMNPDILSRHYRQLSQSFGLQGTKGRLTTFHDLRHTFATVAVAENVDVKSVASYLGHSNAAMTLNIYADDSMDAKRAAASKVSDAFESAAKE